MAEPARKIDLDPDDMTEAELAFFQSGGDTAKLEADGFRPAEPPQPEPQAKPTPEPKPEPEAKTVEPEKPAEPEADAEPDDSEFDQQTGKPKTRGKWVSKKALDAERSARKKRDEEFENQNREYGALREKWARLEERFSVFQDALAVQQPEPEATKPEEELPDPEKDIFAFLKALPASLERKFDARLAPVEQRVGQVSEMTQAQRAEAQMLTNYQSDARRFVQAQPDFLNAYAFLVQQRDAELAAAGFADPQRRMQMIVADERDLVNGAFQANASPSERLYAMAKARGYVKQEAPQPQPAANGATNGNGAAPTPTPAAKPTATETAAEEIARLQRGQDAALSLSNAGGNRSPSITIDDLVNMPDEDFRAFARKNPHLVDQMMGKGAA